MKNGKKRALAATSWAVGEVDQLFVAVARYTRFVLFSKWFFGIFALALLGGLILWPLLGKDKTGLRVSFTSADGTSNSTAPVMQNPHFIGDNAKNERYSVTGARAIQQSAQVIVIAQVEAQMLKPNGSILAARADTATFHQDSKMLVMQGNVTVFDDKGMTFTTPSATMNTATLDTDGSEPIEGDGAQGKLVATGFKIRDKGNRIIFGTTQPGVRLHIERMRRK